LLYCTKCTQEKDDKNFTVFKRNPALKSRKGYVVFCKSCVAEYITMRGNTKQVLRELCQLIDVPYIESLADSALKQFKKKEKTNKEGIASKDQANIFGCYARYLNIINKNYINYSYSDGIRDGSIESKITKLEQLKQDLVPTDVVEKEENIKKNMKYLAKIFGEDTVRDEEKLSKVAKIKFNEYSAYGDATSRSKKHQLKIHLKYLVDEGIFDKSKFSYLYDDLENSNPEIEEKIYSKEWKGYYTQEEIDDLNNYYKDLNTDFKITTRNHKDYARKIAKASLAMDTAYEEMRNGGVGSDKKYKDFKESFDSLSKSAQFAENTRGQNDVALGCFGKVFELVENHHWIPEWDSLEKDQIDVLLDQFSNINKSL
jgi:hypothetical protein